MDPQRLTPSQPEAIRTGLTSFEWVIRNFEPTLYDQDQNVVSAPFVIGGIKCRLFVKYHGRRNVSVKPWLIESNGKLSNVRFQITVQTKEDEICGGYQGTIVKGYYRGSDTVFYVWDNEINKDLKVIFIVYPEDGEQTSEEDLKTEISSKELNEGTDIVSSHMKELYTKGENCDFVIQVKDKDFHVHKVILSARSPVLAAMLQHDMEKNSGTIKIDDYEPDVFKRFLLYLYSGQAEGLSWNNATHLYRLGDKYDLPHLKKECLQFMEGNLCVDTFCDAIALAGIHNESPLAKLAEEFFLRFAKNIIVTNKWQLLMKGNPVACNELFLKYINKSKLQET